MTFQFKFSEVKQPYLNIAENDLDKVRLEVSEAGFELMEIWHNDDQHSHEIWKNSVTSEDIKFNIIQEGEVDKTTASEEDASRADVVSELVDLWLELRAIRNHFTNAPQQTGINDEDDNYLFKKPLTPIELFWGKVRETKTLKETDEAEWDFIINDNIDETIFAFFELSDADRAAIVH